MDGVPEVWGASLPAADCRDFWLRASMPATAIDSVSTSTTATAGPLLRSSRGRFGAAILLACRLRGARRFLDIRLLGSKASAPQSRVRLMHWLLQTFGSAGAGPG